MFQTSIPRNRTITQLLNPFLMLLVALLPTTLFAEASAAFSLDQTKTPEEQGTAIALEADLRDSGFGDWVADLQMVLRNQHGEESKRQMRSRNLEMEKDGDRSMVVFDQPRDVKGTAFLSFTHRSGPDDQWLYLPALKRVKRIASNNRSGPFMGSEFAYEDIASQEVEKYTYKYIGEETIDGEVAYVVERYPTDKKSGYTRQVTYYDQMHFRPLKVVYYDRKDALLKTLTYDGYGQYKDRFWRAKQMKMVNHQTGKSTVLVWEDYKFATGLSERDFDKNSLKRAR